MEGTMTIDNEPTLIEPTVLEAMMRKLSRQDNRFAFNIMLGTLAEHGLIYSSESGRVRYFSSEGLETGAMQRKIQQAHEAPATARRQAEADIAAEQSAAKVPMNIIAKSRSIDRSDLSLLVDRIGQIEHDAWEAGFEAAVRIVEHEGATTLVEILREALADYWETQGVERED
jgi:hypothetical protein